MKGKIIHVAEMRVFKVVVSDPEKGEQMLMVGLDPNLPRPGGSKGRVLVFARSPVDQVRDGRSQFAVLSRETEEALLQLMNPDLPPSAPVELMSPTPEPETTKGRTKVRAPRMPSLEE